MSSQAPPVTKVTDFLRQSLAAFQRETGQSLAVWAVVALFSFTTQVVFRREFLPGEFGKFNTALGIVGLLVVPMLALNQAITTYLAREHSPDRAGRIASLRASSLVITEMAALAWGAISLLLLLVLLPMLGVSRPLVDFFTVLNVLIAIGNVASAALFQSKNRLTLWCALLVIVALARLLLGIWLSRLEPSAESGLGAWLLAGFITLVPVFIQIETNFDWRKSLQPIWDRDFLLHLGATFSVVLALFLFSSADRIVAQSWFGVVNNNNLGFVNWGPFDSYQTAGLLGRALLWGTQPLLLLLFVQRSRLNRTTAASLAWFWIYLGALLSGAPLLGLLSQPLSLLFCGADFQGTAQLVPTFALVMVPLGLLQGLGMFALASRRYPECFLLGGCSVAYTILLYDTGRQPQLMLAYMFGGALCTMMIVLFVGIVRWGRKQP